MTNNIKKLTDYQHLRARVPMYLGSDQPHTQAIVLYYDMQPRVVETTWVPALFTCIREIIDNALDEVVGHGFGNRIDVGFDHANFVFSVQDNGRGIPIDFDKTHKQYLATMVLTEPRTGRNFDTRGEIAGVNGIGSSAVANTSEWFDVEIHRDGKKFKQTFREGLPGATQIDITAPKITNCKTDKTGTFINFHPSKEVFVSRILSEEFVYSRVIEIAICNPTVKVFFNGEQIKVKPRQEQTLFPDQKPITIEIEEGSFRSKFWITHGGDQPEHVHSIVNNIPVWNCGVHIDAFRRLFYNGMISALERESKRRKLNPNRSDIQDGLFIYNITNMMAPNFDSQSKTRLINEEVASIMKKHLEDPELYRDLVKKNTEWIAAIYARCEERTMKKDASELAKLNKATKRLKIEELQDATGIDRSKCKCLIVEGKSAQSGISEGRDPEVHGSVPLRGKVLNVYSKHMTRTAYNQNLKKIAENDALKKIAGALGLTVGERASRSRMRYGEIYITTDADTDGSNIAALMINYFYQLWPELFDPKLKPVIYIFQTPFIIATKGKIKKYWYSDDYGNFNPDDYKGYSITRAKGLGSLNKEDWEVVLKNPKLIPVIDEGDLDECLDLLFSPDADKRKEWLSE